MPCLLETGEDASPLSDQVEDTDSYAVWGGSGPPHSHPLAMCIVCAPSIQEGKGCMPGTWWLRQGCRLIPKFGKDTLRFVYPLW